MPLIVVEDNMAVWNQYLKDNFSMDQKISHKPIQYQSKWKKIAKVENRLSFHTFGCQSAFCRAKVFC